MFVAGRVRNDLQYTGLDDFPIYKPFRLRAICPERVVTSLSRRRRGGWLTGSTNEQFRFHRSTDSCLFSRKRSLSSRSTVPGVSFFLANETSEDYSRIDCSRENLRDCPGEQRSVVFKRYQRNGGIMYL